MRRALPLALTLLLGLGGCAGLELRVGTRGEEGSPTPEQRPAGQRPPEREQRPAAAGAFALEARWRPLQRLEERPALPVPGLSSTTATTISPVLYVRDLSGWLARHPPGSPHFEALLLHEQLHARRQEQDGVDPWVQRYLRDRAFMWAEEQRGWYAQLQRLQQAGFLVDAAAVARTLAGYRNLAGAMVGYDEALRWAQEVLQGRWHPPQD